MNSQAEYGIKMADSKLRCILRKRQVGRIGKRSVPEVRDSVVRLIFENQDLEGVLAELGTRKTTETIGRSAGKDDEQGSDSDDFHASSVSSLLASFRYHSDLSGLPLPLVAAKKCSCLLLEVLTGRDQGDRADQEGAAGIFCSSEQRDRLDVLLKALTQLASDPAQFDNAHFMECIKDKVSFPLELVWLLHRHSVVNFDLFIKCNLGDAAVYRKLTSDILSLMRGKFPPERSDLSQVMLSDLLTVMVNNGFPDKDNARTAPHERSLGEAYQLLVATIFDGVFDYYLEAGDEDVLFLKLSWLTVPKGSSSKFASAQLLNLLCYKPTWTVTQAITNQGTWTSAKTERLLTQLFKELTSGLDTRQQVDILRKTLEEEEVNWKTTLMFASFLLHDAVEAKTHYKELLDYFLQEAFESIEQEGLISAFLLARQAAGEGTHIFMSYGEWFQKTFCEGEHSILTGKKEVAFFLSFLTNLVPLEPAQFLKVHVQHPSFVPSKYSVMLDDYITLAKTRLTDLKVPWESTGIFKARPAETASGVAAHQAKNPVEADVTRAVEGFGQTGKIPSTVIQAIMFKRKYYHSYFLPTLLTPRMLPDIPDTKMKFILALHEANKIPAEQYREYEQKCGEMLTDLLDGAFSEDVVMEELLEPMDALKAQSKKLTEMVQAGHDEVDLRRQLSTISDTLKTLASGSQSCEGVVVDLEGGVLDQKLVEVIDVLVASFCTGTSLPADEGGDTKHGSSLRWQELFATILAGHPSLHQTLLRRIWMVLILKNCKGTEIPDLDLSVLCAVLHAHQLQALFPRVKTNRLIGHHTILEAVSSSLQHTTAEEMADGVRFMYGALRSLLTSKSTCDAVRGDQIPQGVLHKFHYLISRLRHASHHAREQYITEKSFGEVLDFSKSARIIKLEDSLEKLSLAQWCCWELDVVPHLDVLSDVERCSFQHYALFSQFLPILQSDTGNIYWEACGTIINAIMDVDNSVSGNQDEGRRRWSSRRGLTQLAAELLWMMPPAETFPADRLHLIGILEDRCRTGKPNSDPLVVPSVMEGEVRSFLRIIMCLPPVLLLVNHPSQPANDSLIDHLAEFLQKRREYVMEDPATLPLLLTAQIFQAVLSVSSASGSEDAVLGKLIQASPLLKSSLMYHWSKLQPFMMRDTQNLGVFNQFHMSHLRATALTSDVQQSPMMGASSDSEILAMALYCQICQAQEGSRDDWKLICQKLDRKVCIHLSKILVRHIAWSLLHQSGYSGVLEILKILLCQDCSLISDVFRDRSILGDTSFHPHAATLAPTVFFKCFEDNDSATWGCVLSENVLAVALECNCNIRNLYLGHPPTAQGSMKDSAEVLSVEQLTVYNDIIGRMIATSPPNAARHIPDDLMRRCSPFIQSLLEVHPT